MYTEKQIKQMVIEWAQANYSKNILSRLNADDTAHDLYLAQSVFLIMKMHTYLDFQALKLLKLGRKK